MPKTYIQEVEERWKKEFKRNLSIEKTGKLIAGVKYEKVPEQISSKRAKSFLLKEIRQACERMVVEKTEDYHDEDCLMKSSVGIYHNRPSSCDCSGQYNAGYNQSRQDQLERLKGIMG